MSNKKVTVSFEVVSSEDETYRELMSNFANQPSDKGIKVYAVTNGCLHDKIERIENIIPNEHDAESLLDKIYEILGEV